MSVVQPARPAKLVVSILTARRELFGRVLGLLERNYGRADLISAWLAFEYTRYYEAEMGSPLFRRMASFSRLIEQTDLADIKLLTNEVEGRFAESSLRRVNIDPGYLLHERFVLATGKNFSHRIYLGKGIYADLTLTYAKGAFQPLPWTYPDYAAHDIQAFLRWARDKYTVDNRRRSAENENAPATGNI
ncbi:MAG: DUF4416 family protein [Desulfobacterales bacterium]|jgi:hypothetical protein|nr:DUF4416 family protein [Desulfobacterales bacterium]MDD3081111.1 DUF4416 family protein [Desulfobacterales bacterium]MDD3950198.1 DUF4416 family protein [Desulfobacterales bacterium]MDD4463557.1 DUF4416 family protein [Desulfobacterales bacterium]MDY0378733.1 DUF4416 family protein [Desulfobacterales bacterium]